MCGRDRRQREERRDFRKSWDSVAARVRPLGPVLFVVAFLIEGAIRPDYDPARVFVSQLSLGEQGLQQMGS